MEDLFYFLGWKKLIKVVYVYKLVMDSKFRLESFFKPVLSKYVSIKRKVKFHLNFVDSFILLCVFLLKC
uniref:Uncharacterized protein n=1 Tax=Helianthus annuus TaxID=4232 RepID=A0A251T145_HELAN